MNNIGAQPNAHDGANGAVLNVAVFDSATIARVLANAERPNMDECRELRHVLMVSVYTAIGLSPIIAYTLCRAYQADNPYGLLLLFMEVNMPGSCTWLTCSDGSVIEPSFQHPRLNVTHRNWQDILGLLFLFWESMSQADRVLIMTKQLLNFATHHQLLAPNRADLLNPVRAKAKEVMDRDGYAPLTLLGASGTSQPTMAFLWDQVLDHQNAFLGNRLERLLRVLERHHALRVRWDEEKRIRCALHDPLRYLDSDSGEED